MADGSMSRQRELVGSAGLVSHTGSREQNDIKANNYPRLYGPSNYTGQAARGARGVAGSSKNRGLFMITCIFLGSCGILKILQQ
jgi:hypothetical protein